MPEAQKSIKVMIADDHHIFREGFFTLFKKGSGIEVVGQAENGKELITLSKKLNPDVIFMDIKMPVMDGIEATAILKKKQPDVKVIALSMFNDDNLILDMMKAGAQGYLLKNTHKSEIAQAIHSVVRGDVYYCKETSDKLIRLLAKGQAAVEDEPVVFSPKEKEIIRYICDEYSNKEMSGNLYLSVRTIEGYRVKIYEKMKVRNTAGFVVYAIRHGIYEL